MDQDFDKLEIYNNLAEKARSHFGESSLSKLVSTSEYDPNRDNHNFDKICFEANPNRCTPALIDSLASAVLKKSVLSTQKSVINPYLPSIEEARHSLEKGRLCVITGHQNLFEPAFAMYGLQRALGKSGTDYKEAAKNTHIIATRALATVDILGKWPLTSLASQIANVYYTFPATENYADIPLDFRKAHNRNTVFEFFFNTKKVGSIGVMSTAATTERRNAQGAYVLKRVTSGTMSLLQKDWDIWPIGGNFNLNKFKMIPGQIIPSSEVSPDRIHQAMSWIAETRNENGVKAIYEGD